VARLTASAYVGFIRATRSGIVESQHPDDTASGGPDAGFPPAGQPPPGAYRQRKCKQADPENEVMRLG